MSTIPPYNRLIRFALPVEVAPGERSNIHITLFSEPGISDATAIRFQNEIRQTLLRLSGQLGDEFLFESQDGSEIPDCLLR